MGDNTIHYRGHIRMMGAVQPFISGAISKTVNMPEDVTVEDVEQLHIEAWQLGLKAVAIYRDNCKVAQPLATAKKDGGAIRAATCAGGSEAEAHDAELGRRWPSSRRRWPDQRQAGRGQVGRSASGCPAGASPRPSPSGWPTARATSRWASTRTAGRARCS